MKMNMKLEVRKNPGVRFHPSVDRRRVLVARVPTRPLFKIEIKMRIKIEIEIKGQAGNRAVKRSSMSTSFSITITHLPHGRAPPRDVLPLRMR
jgi:hypothetical protein